MVDSEGHRPVSARAGRTWSARDGGWLLRWIVVVATAEAVGFIAPAIVGVQASDSPALIPLLLLAGAVEGALLGCGQAVVLRMRLPRLRVRAWVLLTVIGAVAAYSVGMIPSALSPLWTTWGWPAQAALLAGVALVLLLSIGGAQWLELRRHLWRAGWWIAGTAAAWLVALALFLTIAMPLWHEGQDPGTAILVGVVAGLVMATAMAAVTGVTIQVLLRGPRGYGEST